MDVADRHGGRFPGCQFLHYNIVSAKRLLIGAGYGRLATRHPDLLAVKSGASRLREEILELTDAALELQLFLGGPGYAAVRDMVQCRWLISLGSTNHAATWRMFTACGPELAELAQVSRLSPRR